MRDRKLPPSTSLPACVAMMSPRGSTPVTWPRDDHRLRRARHVRRARCVGAVGRAGGRDELLGALGDAGRRGPAAEAAFEQRHQLRQRQVGDDEDLGIVGPQPLLLEADDVVAGEALDRVGRCRRRGRRRDGWRPTRSAGMIRAGDAVRVRCCGWRCRSATCVRTRSSSAGAKVGCSTTVSSRSRLAARGWPTAPTGSPCCGRATQPVLMLAPSSSCRSAICWR